MLVLYRNFHSSIYSLNNTERILLNLQVDCKIKLVEASKSSVVRVQATNSGQGLCFGFVELNIYASDLRFQHYIIRDTSNCPKESIIYTFSVHEAVHSYFWR